VAILQRWKTWVPVLTLFGIAAGYVVDRTWRAKPTELVIQPAPPRQIPPLELPPRGRTLAGKVVDLADVPLADALVWLRAGNAPHFTYTDGQGAFRLDAIEDPPWSATVLAQGHAPLVREIAEGSETILFKMESPLGPAPSLPMIARTRFAGTLKSTLPATLAGCEVVLIPTAAPETLSAPLPRRATVAADGRFAFDDLIVGEYRIEARPAWARGGSWPDLLPALDGGAPRLLELSGKDGLLGLDLDLSIGDLGGRLVGLEGEAIEGALVLVSALGDPSRVWPPETSRADGTFALEGLPAGSYLLTIRAGSASVQKEVLVSTGEAASVDLAPLDVRPVR